MVRHGVLHRQLTAYSAAFQEAICGKGVADWADGARQAELDSYGTPFLKEGAQRGTGRCAR